MKLQERFREQKYENIVLYKMENFTLIHMYANFFLLILLTNLMKINFFAKIREVNEKKTWIETNQY